MPAGFKLIHRKDKITGEDVWIVRMYDCYAPLAGCIEYFTADRAKLDDTVVKSIQVFLTNGDVEIHNIAIERCFRHIAMGRRNWGKAGSHKAAENLAFMYSLYESCKMNNLNFGRYIEDILTRMKDGDKDYKSMLPCYYVEITDEVKECA